MPRHPRTSAFNDSLSAGVFSSLARRASAHTGPIAPLHVGDTWREPWPGLRADSPALAGTPLLYTYAPPRGEPALLEAAHQSDVRRSGRPIDPDTYLIVSGATSGLSVVVQTLLDPGDEVLLPAPFWPLVRGIIASRGARPIEIPLWDRRLAPGFDLEAALERAVTPRTAALYVNSPHNPTGGILTDEEAAAFARVARRHELWLLCDEVYEELYYGPTPPPPLWARKDFAPRAIAIHSLSKAFGFAGGRVGWVHGPRDVMRRVLATQTHQVYCAPRPMQLGAALALRGASDWLSETRALYRNAALRAAATFAVPPPLGGTFLFVDAAPFLPEGATDAMPLLERCLDEAGVLLTPGVSSGAAFARHFRVCFTSVAPDVLEAAFSRLAPVLAATRHPSCP